MNTGTARTVLAVACLLSFAAHAQSNQKEFPSAHAVAIAAAEAADAAADAADQAHADTVAAAAEAAEEIRNEDRLRGDRWAFAGENELATVHLDVKTVVMQGNAVRAWERTTFRKSGGPKRTPGLKQLVSLIDFNCDRRTIQYLETLAYDNSGNIMEGSGPNVSERKAVAPDSLGEVTFEVACGLRD